MPSMKTNHNLPMYNLWSCQDETHHNSLLLLSLNFCHDQDTIRDWSRGSFHFLPSWPGASPTRLMLGLWAWLDIAKKSTPLPKYHHKSYFFVACLECDSHPWSKIPSIAPTTGIVVDMHTLRNNIFGDNHTMQKNCNSRQLCTWREPKVGSPSCHEQATLKVAKPPLSRIAKLVVAPPGR